MKTRNCTLFLSLPCSGSKSGQCGACCYLTACDQVVGGKTGSQAVYAKNCEGVRPFRWFPRCVGTVPTYIVAKPQYLRVPQYMFFTKSVPDLMCIKMCIGITRLVGKNGRIPVSLMNSLLGAVVLLNI